MAKKCSKCKVEKTLEEFSNRKKAADGKQTWCKSCMKPITAAAAIKWRENHRDEDRRRARRGKLKREYGITESQYESMVLVCGGLCEICGHPESTNEGGKLCVDHNHSNGEVRGLLCSRCNRAIGFLRDDPAIIRRAASYVEDASDAE